MNLLHEVTRTVQELEGLLSTIKLKNEIKQEKKEIKVRNNSVTQNNEHNATHYDTMLSSIADYIEGDEDNDHIDENVAAGGDADRSSNGNVNDNTHLLHRLQDALARTDSLQQKEYTLYDVMRHKGQIRAGNILVQLLRNSQEDIQYC